MDDRLDPKRPGPYDDLFLGRDMSTGRKLPHRGLRGPFVSLVFLLAVAVLAFSFYLASDGVKATSKLSPTVQRTPAAAGGPGTCVGSDALGLGVIALRECLVILSR